jgi:hypothetical protein
MFNNSAGFKFRGGNFYNVSGDVHLQTHQHLSIQGHNPHEAAPQLPAGSTSALEDGHELPGMARNLRPARPAPYGAFKFTSIFCYVSYRQICPLAHVFRPAPPITKIAQDRYQRPRVPRSPHSRDLHVAPSPTPPLN